MGINAPVTNAAGARVCSSAPIVVDLFYTADTNAVPNPLGTDSLTAAGFSLHFSSLADGYFLGGARSLNNVSNTLLVQVRAWDTNYGSSYAAARDAGGQFGYSVALLVTLTGPPAPPPALSGLTGFRLTTLDQLSAGSLNPPGQGVVSPPVVAIGAGGTPSAPGPFDLLSYSDGCGPPWLEATRGGPATNTQTSVIVTLHNSAAGRPYRLWSATNISLTHWSLETNFVGASGQSQTQVRIPMDGRTNLFLRTEETTASFFGLCDTNLPNSEPPDTMGVVGPDHFVELLNIGIAVFAKTNGALLQYAEPADFFTVGTNRPAGTLYDPRILYDHGQQRWVASAIDLEPGSSDLILAVSKTNTPLDLISNWVKYRIAISWPGALSDYDTMGVDANGIYLSVLHFAAGTSAGHTVVAIRKQDIYNGTNQYTVLTNHPGLTAWTIQPAVNFDAVASDGYAWFVAKGLPEYGTRSGTNCYQGGAVLYRRLQWSGASANWVDATWRTNESASYRDYYDLDGTNTLYYPEGGLGAPQAGGTNTIALNHTGSRLMMAVVRNGYLWTCQQVGLSGTNGVYAGDQSGTNVDRSAAQWIRFEVGPSGLTESAHERVFDGTPTSPFWYYFPSLMVNCAGDMLMGFSGSSANDYVGAYYSWLSAGSSTSLGPFVIQSGTANYNGDLWGDYSCTSLDPTDDWTLWTVQEYADGTHPVLGLPWSTWIIQVSGYP